MIRDRPHIIYYKASSDARYVRYVRTHDTRAATIKLNHIVRCGAAERRRRMNGYKLPSPIYLHGEMNDNKYWEPTHIRCIYKLYAYICFFILQYLWRGFKHHHQHHNAAYIFSRFGVLSIFFFFFFIAEVPFAGPARGSNVDMRSYLGRVWK